ncbi:MAG: hypothetical protein AAF804_13370 [Bacteroidota bacterium]
MVPPLNHNINHMRRFLCLLLLGLNLSALFAQQIRELTRLETKLPPEAEVFAFSNSRGVLLLFQEGNTAQVFQLNPSLEVISQFVVSDLPQASDFDRIGFTYREGKLSICYLERRTQEVQVLEVWPEDAYTELFRIDEAELARGDLQWGTFTHEGVLHMIRTPRGGEEIRISKFEGGGAFSSQTYPVPQPFIEALSGQVVRNDSSNQGSLDQTYSSAKMYLQSGLLTLTADQATGTDLLRLDLASEEAHYQRFDYPLGTRLGNSIFDGERLLQFALSTDSFHVRASDIYGGYQTAEFTYEAQQDWPLRGENSAMAADEGGSYYVDYSCEELHTAWLEASHIGLGLAYPEPGILALTLGSVAPSRERGLTGEVIQESARTLSFSTYLSAYNLKPMFAPEGMVATRRFPPEEIRRQPQMLTFSIGDDAFWGYYEAETGSFLLGN